jgi:hypothetical protein
MDILLDHISPTLYKPMLRGEPRFGSGRLHHVHRIIHWQTMPITTAATVIP